MKLPTNCFFFGPVEGTILWCAPEMSLRKLDAEKVRGPFSDIWSLGVTALELTNSKVFVFCSPQRDIALFQVVSRELPSLPSFIQKTVKYKYLDRSHCDELLGGAFIASVPPALHQSIQLEIVEHVIRSNLEEQDECKRCDCPGKGGDGIKYIYIKKRKIAI